MNRYGWLMSNIMNTTDHWDYMVKQANEAPQGAARFNFDNLNMDQIKSQSSVWLSTFTVVGERSRGDESGKAGGGGGIKTISNINNVTGVVVSATQGIVHYTGIGRDCVYFISGNRVV